MKFINYEKILAHLEHQPIAVGDEPFIKLSQLKILLETDSIETGPCESCEWYIPEKDLQYKIPGSFRCTGLCDNTSCFTYKDNFCSAWKEDRSEDYDWRRKNLWGCKE